MELELQKERFACYRALPQLCDTHEETMETIVPDYSPDIARIVDVSGCLFLRSREISEGKVSVSGTVRMTMLYLSEDTPGLRTLEYSVPFDYSLDGKLSDGGAELCLEGHITSPEVRMLNPRKIFTRVSLELCFTPYAPAMLTACSAVAQQEAYQIQTLCEQHTVPLIRAVREKDFVFSDEVVLSSAKEPVRELLRSQCALRVTECKSISNKLILKGLVCFGALYLSESGAICQMNSELPFSQIIDGIDDEGSDVFCEATVRLTGAEVRLGSEGSPDDARTVSLKLFLSAFILLRQTKTVCCIADLYSTTHELSAQSETLELSGSSELFVRQMSVREQIETGVDVQSVLCADVTFSGASITQDEMQSTLRTSAAIKVLYLDETGSPLLAERRCEVVLTAELPAMGRIAVRGVCAGDIAASASAGGIEVRFPVEFLLATVTTPCYPCLCSLSAEKRDEEPDDVPSLVLRAMTSGQRLWDLAKQYRTTVDDILKANELAEEAAAVIGQMLLIPRRR